MPGSRIGDPGIIPGRDDKCAACGVKRPALLVFADVAGERLVLCKDAWLCTRRYREGASAIGYGNLVKRGIRP